MKKFTLFFSALLFAMTAMAAKTTAVVTASETASYITGDGLKVTGLSAAEVGYNGSLVLTVYGWDGGGLSTGYAAILSLQGEEAASCDDGLKISQDANGVITITGTMIGYPHNYQFDGVSVNPKQAKKIELVSDNMEVTKSITDEKDFKLTANTKGYAVEIELYRAVSNPYKNYKHKAFRASVNYTEVVLADTINGFATFSQEGELVKFEASLIYNMDTLALTLTGFPYTAPEDILPVDTVELNFVNATVQYKLAMNRISATSEVPEAELFIAYMGAMFGTKAVADLAVSSSLTVEGQEITFQRGEITVIKDGDNKHMTAGLLGSNRVWYNIHLTTMANLPTAVDNLSIQTPATKMMKNGQLIILKNGVEYNALGTAMK